MQARAAREVELNSLVNKFIDDYNRHKVHEFDKHYQFVDKLSKCYHTIFDDMCDINDYFGDDEEIDDDFKPTFTKIIALIEKVEEVLNKQMNIYNDFVKHQLGIKYTNYGISDIFDSIEQLPQKIDKNYLEFHGAIKLTIRSI